MNKQRTINLKLFVLLVIMSLFFVSCNVDNDIDDGGQEEMNECIPSGFISLKEAEEIAAGVMTGRFFEDFFSFVDADGYGVGGGALVTDRSFIVKCQGEYYVNEEKFFESMAIAAISPEQRLKRYALEDMIQMRGAGEIIYDVEITTFETIKTDDVTTYTIEYTATSNVVENGRRPFISLVTTKGGVNYTVYNNIDSETLNTLSTLYTLSVDITRNDEIETILFASPDCQGLDYIIEVDSQVG